MERREFIKKSLLTTSCAALGSVAFLKLNRAYFSQKKSLNPRMVIRSPLEHDSTEDSPSMVNYLNSLDRGLELLTGEKGLDAYRKLFPFGKVAIKVNCASILNPSLSLVDALLKRLSDLQIKKVIVFDRFSSDLEACGYPIRKTGNYKFIGSDALNHSYPKRPEVFPSCLPQKFRPRSTSSYKTMVWDSSFSNVLWENCDHLINIAVLKDHARCGVSLTLKNTYGMIHNPHQLHGQACNPYITQINQHPLLRVKSKLFLIDGHSGQYNGGPKWDSKYLFFPQCLYLSNSPLALDFEGWKMIESERKKAGFPTLSDDGRSPIYLQNSLPVNWSGYEIKETQI